MRRVALNIIVIEFHHVFGSSRKRMVTPYPGNDIDFLVTWPVVHVR